MAQNKPPMPPRIEDVGLEKWMTDRGYDYHSFIIRVGDNPDDPIISRPRLAAATKNAQGDPVTTATIRRWLGQLKREMGMK